MIKVEIGHWQMGELFEKNISAYHWLHEQPEDLFENRSKRAEWSYNEKGVLTSKGYEGLSFYVNDFSKVPHAIWKYCTFKPMPMLEMMDGARIHTENVLEAAQRNQIMLPNNLMLQMQELRIETNACTNEINNLLKDGWKLIAVLPQHQQARPDYLLGKL